MHRVSFVMRHRRFVARAMVFATVAGIAMLGNLRLQASEVGRDSGFDQPTANPTLAHSEVKPQLVSTVEADHADDLADHVQLVPAIYAWNPDVRFVYFRHVSKWM